MPNPKAALLSITADMALVFVRGSGNSAATVGTTSGDI
jgi:hypothetical protein